MPYSTSSEKATTVTRGESSTAFFSDDDAKTLSILMATFSAISIVAGSLSLYWFARMRRAFRHHLIMLLIISNLWRALWYFLFPVIGFAKGGIQTHSIYCQVSGFMLAFGIQGADFAVLVMAIHAALCIFKSSTELREAGLYPFRKIVYALWIAFPTICCSLAFINKDSAYATTGGYCYLPVFPIWYRLALSWIPRYIILITIAVLYLGIFLFVKREFAHYRLSRSRNSSGGPEPRTSVTEEVEGSEQSSPIQNNSDAIESASPTLLGSVTPRLSEKSPVEASSVDLGKQPGMPLWENYTFGTSAPLAKLPDSATTKPDRSKFRSWRQHGNERRDSGASRESITNIILALEENEPTLDFLLVDSKNRPVKHVSMRTRHRAINRQMRMVFVYPLVYWFSWIVPFVSHCLSYNDSYARRPQLGLLATANVILALQCAIDTLLFSLREKPWRARDTDNESAKTFWGSLMPWRGRPSRERHSSIATRESYQRTSAANRRSMAAAAAQKASQLIGGGIPGNGAGRTKAQNAAEAMAAKQRKNAETIEARQGAEGKRRERQISVIRRGGAERSWWEVEGRRRKDSVLLGDEGADLEKGVGHGVSSKTRARHSVDPIGEEPEAEQPDRHRSTFVGRISEKPEEECSSDEAAGPSAGYQALHLDTALRSKSTATEVSPRQRDSTDRNGNPTSFEPLDDITKSRT